MAAKRDFTDRYLKALKPTEHGKRAVIFDAQVPGFGIRVTDRCSDECKGAFVLVTRFPGSSNPVPRRIGDYPAMSLAKAREIAREWREDLRQGVDPKVKRAERLRQEQRRRADTFAALFATFAEEHLTTLRSGGDVKSAIERRVIPEWGDRPVSEIRRADVNELIRKLRKVIPIGANRVLAYLKKFFNWMIDQDLIENSPAAAVKRPTKETKRDRVLSDAEICAIWQVCSNLGTFGRAFKMMLATGQRRSEVGEMRWREINRESRLWTIPRERTKADRSQEVPLSDMALSILDECPKLEEFVFTTGRRSFAKVDDGVAVAISGWSKAKRQLDALAYTKAKGIAADHGEAPETIADWRLHDLRRTAATHMARLGVDRVVIAKVLNHAETEVTAICDRHRYDREKRRALDLWGERLTAIVKGDGAGGKAVQFVASARPL
jgi:integrase